MNQVLSTMDKVANASVYKIDYIGIVSIVRAIVLVLSIIL